MNIRNAMMTKLIKVLFPFYTLIILTIIICSSCSKDDNLPGDGCNIDIENNFIGKLKSDMCNAILKPDSTLWTWGWNISGQLGIETEGNIDIPRKVLFEKKIIDFDMNKGMAVTGILILKIEFRS